jgi:hypothetical protein
MKRVVLTAAPSHFPTSGAAADKKKRAGYVWAAMLVLEVRDGELMIALACFTNPRRILHLRER